MYNKLASTDHETHIAVSVADTINRTWLNDSCVLRSKFRGFHGVFVHGVQWMNIRFGLADNLTQTKKVYLLFFTISLPLGGSLPWFREEKIQKREVKSLYWCLSRNWFCMMTSSNGNISALPMDSPHKGRWGGVCCVLWSTPHQIVEQTIEMLVIWDAIALIMTSM